MSRFRGSYTVMVTPFRNDGSLNEDVLRRFVDWQISQGTQGLIPLGSTGEFLSLTREEKKRVAEIVVSEANGRVPVLVGSAAERTEDAIEYSRDAEKAGADGLMIIPPFYSSPTPDELVEHFRRIAAAVSIPIMVYNNPFTANVDLKPESVARLAEIDQVRYIKESSGDVTRVTQILQLCGDRMQVFAGYHPWEAYRCGATGYVSVFANIAPGLSRDMFVETVDRNNGEAGRAIYHRVMPLLDAISGDLYVSATKAALEMMGMQVGPPRAPRLRLPKERERKLRQVLGDLGLVARAAAQ